MYKKKEDTPLRIARRKYEEKKKAERREASGNFQTKIPRKDYDEICKFLEKHNIKKIDLIYTGYMALKEQIEQETKTK